MTYRAIIYYRSGGAIAVSASKRAVQEFIDRTPGARYLPAAEYRALQRDMPGRGGHPPVFDLDERT